MGEVYKAKDTRLGRKVAIKVLPAGMIGNQDHTQRFLSEARAASLLNQLHRHGVCAGQDLG